ncbi:MAG: L,D-transpeptidase [Actinomycetota bacterium]
MKGSFLRSWTFVALAASIAVATPIAGVTGSEPTPSREHGAVVAAQGSVAGADGLRRPQPSEEPTVAPDPQPEPRPEPAPEPNLLVEIPRDLQMSSRPGGGRTVGVVPNGSRFYDVPTVAWVQQVSEDGRFGRLRVPYAPGHRSGWIPLRTLARDHTWVTVHIDLSRRRITVERRGQVLFGTRTAIGSASSPTPVGRYFVTDRIAFGGGSPLGAFAFGISGIQPNLPAGWTGGDQLAIHGTNDPGSVGQAVSAGCLRVSASALERLKPLMRLGTPVVITR